MNKIRPASKLKTWLLLSLLLVTIQDCSEPFEFDVAAEESTLVVDGFITNQLKEHLIRLSYTASRTGNISAVNPVRNGVVTLVDDLGNSWPVRHDRAQRYLTPPMQAEAGRSYQIIVEVNGKTYQSSFETLPNVSFTPNLEISFTTQDYRQYFQGSLFVNKQGLSISAKINKSVISNREPVRYQWYLNTCRIELPSGRSCSIYDDASRSTQLYLHQDNYVEGLESLQYFKELTWIPKPLNSSIPLIVEIDQFIMSEKAYALWSKINNAIESKGTVFDPAPSRYLGNIEDMATGELTLGFFGVYYEASNYEKIVVPGF